MAIPALMTTPYANAKPASSRAPRAAAPDRTQTALQIMSRLTGADVRGTTAPPMTSTFAPGSVGDQNLLANAGVYREGTIGAENARANGTGVVVPADWNPASLMTPGGGFAETRSFDGGPADAAALNNGLDTWARGGAPAPTGRASSSGGGAVDMMAGLPAGPAAALKVSDMRTALAGARTQQRDIDPIMTMLTPGLNPAQRSAQLGADADNQRLTGVPPEMAAARTGYLDKLALRASGVPEAMNSGRPVYQTTDASGRPVLSERRTTGPGGQPLVDMSPLAPAATDQNRSAVEMMAAGGRQAMAAGAESQQTAMHGTELGKLIRERDAAVKTGRTDSVAHYDKMIAKLQEGSAGQFPRTIDAGGRKLIEVATGKFTDEKGNPVEWRNEDRPLNVNEFLMSPALSERFGGDYSKYREAHATATKATEAKPGVAAGGAGAPEKSAPKVVYNHADVQAELRRRGLIN